MNSEDIRLAIGYLLGIAKAEDSHLVRIDDISKMFGCKNIMLTYATVHESIMVFRDETDNGYRHHCLIGEVYIGDFTNLSRETQRNIIKVIKAMIDLKYNPKGGIEEKLET